VRRSVGLGTERTPPSSEVRPSRHVEAIWLVPRQGHHSCGTAPDSDRTSLLAADGTSTVSAITRTLVTLAGCRGSRESPYNVVMIRRPVFLLAALAAALLVLKKRSARPPERSGAWEPVDLSNHR